MTPEDIWEKAMKGTEPERDDHTAVLRCLVCNAPVPGAGCGRKVPCPDCGFPYPLGDCSDLAEN